MTIEIGHDYVRIIDLKEYNERVINRIKILGINNNLDIKECYFYGGGRDLFNFILDLSNIYYLTVL